MHPDDDVLLIGTSAALTELDALLDRACTGEVTVAVLEGPAGIGKSTLLRRFRHRHPDVTAVVVSGLPWERSCAGALLGRLIVAEGADVGSDRETGGWDAATVGAALARRWDESAREKPLVVTIDDAQHADPASLQAVVSAVARLHGAQFLLLLARGTGPDGGGDAGAADILEHLSAEHVRVQPLTPEQVRLLAARVAAVDLPLPVARRLCEHTAGNPRHLLEILRDTPPSRWSDWQIRLPVPGSVQSRVEISLRACSASCRALVEAAAVLGPNPVLADAALLGEVGEPVGALDEAYAAGLLGPAAGHGLDTLSFAGPFVREAVHATLTPAQRHDLHLRAAEVVTDETEQLRHRVEAAPLPDPGLADALVALARRKADDGSWAVVAGALIDASRISPTRAERENRLIQAVDALAGAGLLGQAVDALPDVEALPVGPRRDAVLAYVAIQRGSRAEAVSYLESAWRQRGADRTAAAVRLPAAGAARAGRLGRRRAGALGRPRRRARRAGISARRRGRRDRRARARRARCGVGRVRRLCAGRGRQPGGPPAPARPDGAGLVAPGAGRPRGRAPGAGVRVRRRPAVPARTGSRCGRWRGSRAPASRSATGRGRCTRRTRPRSCSAPPAWSFSARSSTGPARRSTHSGVRRKKRSATCAWAPPSRRTR